MSVVSPFSSDGQCEKTKHQTVDKKILIHASSSDVIYSHQNSPLLVQITHLYGTDDWD